MTKKKKKLVLTCPGCKATTGPIAVGRAGYCFADFDGVRIYLPLPSKKLMTRQKHGKHWTQLNDLIAEHRFAGKKKAEEYACDHRPLWTAATLTASFYHPNRSHFQDDDNLDHWIKHYRDGIQDAGIVTDDRVITVKGIYQDVAGDGNREGVIITIRNNTRPEIPIPTPGRHDKFEKLIVKLEAKNKVKRAKKKQKVK